MSARIELIMVIGVTGGMGCGKSTAARMFEECGFRRIDSDALVRERVLTAPEIIAEAERRFGPSVLMDAPTARKQIDRAALARVLFDDPDPANAKRAAWEDLVLPMVYALWRELLDSDLRARWVIEAPLLYEKGLEKEFDFVVCVASSTATQYARLAERGVSHTLAEQRISKQLPLAQKIENADFVLSNDGAPQFLRDQITHLSARFVRHA